jgi:hypothetical protein
LAVFLAVLVFFVFLVVFAISLAPRSATGTL